MKGLSGQLISFIDFAFWFFNQTWSQSRFFFLYSFWTCLMLPDISTILSIIYSSHYYRSNIFFYHFNLFFVHKRRTIDMYIKVPTQVWHSIHKKIFSFYILKDCKFYQKLKNVVCITFVMILCVMGKTVCRGSVCYTENYFVKYMEADFL